MSVTSPGDEVPRKYFRVDAQHCLLEMMQDAVSHLSRSQVDIRLDENTVCLTGQVDSWTDKQLAQESIRGLSGSLTIHNELRVAGSEDFV